MLLGRTQRFWLQLVALVCCLTISSQALAERRVALVIGNSNYKNVTPLSNSGDDAKMMADTLRNVGFDLIHDRALLDLDKTEFETAIQEFSRSAQGADIAIFYFAGYGVQIRGSNYLLPVNADPTREADVPLQTVNANLLLRLIEDAGTKLSLVVLDACHDNPFSDRGFRSVGLGQMQAPEGTLISFASQPGRAAMDGTDGHSPFTEALSDIIKRPGLSIFDAFNKVGPAVMEATSNQQQPWVSSSPIRGEFYFVPPVAAVPSPAAKDGPGLCEAKNALSPTAKQVQSPTAAVPNKEAQFNNSAEKKPLDNFSIVLSTGPGRIEHVAFSPDGRTIVSADRESGVLKLWDYESGRELRTLRGHTGSVAAIAFSPNGRTIVSGSSDKTAKVWDVESGRELHTLVGHSHSDGVSAVAFSPDGRTIVSTDDKGIWKLWDAATGKELRTSKSYASGTDYACPGEGCWIMAIAFSPDGRTIASGSADHRVRLWDVATGKLLRTLGNHSSWVTAVAFSPDGRTVVSSSEDKTLKLWDPQSKREPLNLRGHTGEVNVVAFSPDGRTIASGSQDKTLKIWDAGSGRELQSFTNQPYQVVSLAFAPDGRTIISAGADDGLKILANGQELRSLSRHSTPINAVAFSRDNLTIAYSTSDNSLKLWDLVSGRELRRLLGSGGARALGFSPDSKRIVSGTSEGELKIWDAVSGGELCNWSAGTNSISAVAFSPDGRAIVSGDFEGALKLWDSTSGRELRTLSGAEKFGRLVAVAFSPDGRTIASGDYYGFLKLWDVASGRKLRTLGRAGTHPPDILWGLTSLSFSPDGRTIVSGSPEGAGLEIWGVTEGRRLRMLNGQSEWVTSVSFSPDGGLIVSGSHDGSLKIWDAVSLRELSRLAGHSGEITTVGFSPDGRKIVSGSDDGSIRIWSSKGDGLATAISIAKPASEPTSEWLIITPEGFFDASSPKATQAISIVRGLQAHSADRFYGQLFRPDLVREKLAGDPEGKVQKAAAELALPIGTSSHDAPPTPR
jgi:WD40 repeat protein